jgi:hypothetical protein
MRADLEFGFKGRAMHTEDVLLELVHVYDQSGSVDGLYRFADDGHWSWLLVKDAA